jgi:hypothetical protein
MERKNLDMKKYRVSGIVCRDGDSNFAVLELHVEPLRIVGDKSI